MGAAIATAAVNSIVSESVNVMNTFTQNCTVNANSQQIFDFGKGCTSGDVNIKQHGGVTVSQQCLQNGSVSNTIENVMSTRLQQKAQAVSQVLGLGLSVSSAYTNQVDAVSSSITTHFKQTCATNTNSQFVFRCRGANIGNVTIELNNNDNISQSCVASYNVNNDVVQKLHSIISQQSSACQRADFIIAAMTIGAFIFIAIIYFSLQELQGPIGWLVVFLILGSVLSGVIYAYFAPRNKYYPYNRP